MQSNSLDHQVMAASPADDEQLFGWNPTPGIVSVWAQRDGQALVWQRVDGQIRCTAHRFRPWLFARTLDDLQHLGKNFQLAQAASASKAVVTYHELDGPADSYRFLLSARPGYRLEAALLQGAARRLGRAITHFNLLDDWYYRVGPVEQYLMLTGRAYFRGLTYNDVHRLQFDLETTSLDPDNGRIILIAVRDNRGLAITLDAPKPQDEARLIAELCTLIRHRDPDIIENHNLFRFDFPFLERRATMLGVPLILSRPQAPQHIEHYADPHGRGPFSRRRMRASIPGRELIDTLDAVRRYDFAARQLPSHRLKDVARHFGVATAERVYIAGQDVFATYEVDPERVRRYALDDVAEVDALSQRLLGAPFALAGMAPRRYERVASAGPAMGILEPMLVRAYLHAGAALPYSAEDANFQDRHAGGAAYLLATGVAQHVVKADVASLYPSIMRAYRVGSAADRLGVLLALVSRLTDLRLMHKAAARTATPGSREAGLHDSNQAAFKIIINAAYGYLGAGRMALFADRHAADEITRRGRAVLDHVLAELNVRGMALIEADTDGVYFGVPPTFTEADERTLVAEVATTLPDGIQLEYEGRYQAMLSHEVKNYALLTYNGELILRGIALRSSRSEPFGDQFLRQALRCTLTGNIAGVREAFVSTIAQLRMRQLTAADVATRTRLSKTPDQYHQTRNIHREQAYEALLAAGHTNWTPGERVRIYRTEHGTWAWIPDGGEATHQDDMQRLADARDYDVAHYLQVLITSYVSRLRKAFETDDFDQLFRLDEQASLFDRPIDAIEPRWIRCQRSDKL